MQAAVALAPMRGIHVHSMDPAERARLRAAVQASGIPLIGSIEAADLVLMGARGLRAADCIEHARKHSAVPFVVAGASASAESLETAAAAGVIAILPDPASSQRFRIALRGALNVARELTHLRAWALEIGEEVEIDRVDAPRASQAGAAESTSAEREGMLLRERLRAATANRAFELFFQPKVSADSIEVSGFEALIRWSDPQLGSVSPAVFIPIAEELGLVETIGDWCIREACSQVARWSSLGLDPGRVAVNVSPVQFQRVDFASRLIQCIDAAGLATSQLEIEITEGCLIESDEAIATLRALSEAGVHIAVDDFGTGYSSLQYLRRLPIHCLKIDRVFVMDLETDASARSLTAAIISLAWNLGLRVVAEGVESEAQWRFLADHGCDEIQGFYYSRPLTAADAEMLLRQEQSQVSSARDRFRVS